MTLPEKVKDLTQHEWLEVRERLAEAASDAEAADMYAARSLRFSEQADRLAEELREALRDRDGWLAEAGEWEERYDEAHHQHCAEHEQLASQLALAMTWGAEVCAALRKTRTMLDEVEGRAYGDDAYIIGLEAERDKLKKGAKLASAIVANNATTAELLERAEQAEAYLADARRHLAAVVAEAREERCRLLRALHCATVTLADGRVGPSDIIGWPDMRALADAEPAARAHDEAVRAEERAEVVAWLRARIDALYARGHHFSGALRDSTDYAADAIERREHLGGRRG